MDVRVNDPTVAAGHPGFHRIYAPDRLTLGFMFPVVQVADVFPDMSGELAMARRIDELGFGALWVRDVPLHDLDFGDVGQVYDSWVWLGQVAAVTTAVTLATGAIVLPLRHPLHVAKAAASVDRLSGARFGCSAHTVRQRLRLAAVSPVLLQAYRDGALTLDHLTAFAVTEDQAAQERV